MGKHGNTTKKDDFFGKRRRARSTRTIMLLFLAVLVAGSVAAVFHMPATAKTYQVVALECTAVAPEGSKYADFFVHIHNDDCFDEYGELVCPLEEIEPHVHDAECYTTVQNLICGETESDGHMHTEECYTRVQGELICTLSTEPVYNEDGAIIAEGHVHTDECYAWTNELTCGMQEGEGAHHHTDQCYEYVTKLSCRYSRDSAG